MNINVIPSLQIRYDLLPGVPQVCMPQVVDDVFTSFYIKSRINFSLASNAIMRIPTGIRILDFPEFVVNANTPNAINMMTEAQCISIEDMLIDYGLRVLGPQHVTKFYDGELFVIVQNEHKEIFSAETGDEIAIITFNSKPFVTLVPDLEQQNIPTEMR